MTLDPNPNPKQVITEKSDAIGPDNFILAFMLAWGVCGLALLWELCQLRFRDRIVSLALGRFGLGLGVGLALARSPKREP